MRGKAQSRRSESLQSPDEMDEEIVERQPVDEAASSEAIEGTAREARDHSRSRS
jgi:hypothetical protein